MDKPNEEIEEVPGEGRTNVFVCGECFNKLTITEYAAGGGTCLKCRQKRGSVFNADDISLLAYYKKASQVHALFEEEGTFTEEQRDASIVHLGDLELEILRRMNRNA